jgi:hypothetical protein
MEASMGLWLTATREEEHMDPAVIGTLDELRTLNTPALKQKYLVLFGVESKSSNKAILFRRIAWRHKPKED